MIWQIIMLISTVLICIAFGGSPKDNVQRSSKQRTEIPDLNGPPPPELKSSQTNIQNQEGHTILETSSIPTFLDVESKIHQPKRLRLPYKQRDYSNLTQEEKKAYSRYVSIRHKARFATWSEERKNEFRKAKNESKKKQGLIALREANRRYQATYRQKKKLLKKMSKDANKK